MLLAIFVIAGYNGLVRARNAYKNAFAQIDVQLQRRFDLIPNLVETAKGYMAHERETLEAVIAARSARDDRPGRGAGQSRRPGGDAAAGRPRRGAERRVGPAASAVAEAYPDLKANQNMMQLSEELTSTENKVAFARQAYNDSVMDYNNKREVFPASSSRACSTSPRPRCWRSRGARRRCARRRRSSSDRTAAVMNFFDAPAARPRARTLDAWSSCSPLAGGGAAWRRIDVAAVLALTYLVARDYHGVDASSMLAAVVVVTACHAG